MKPIGRRRFLEAAAAGAATALLPGCGSRDDEVAAAVAFEPGRPLPWINWAGNQHCFPRHRLAPASEAELVDALRRAEGVVRAVGSSHAFNAAVPTDDTLIATDLLSGKVSRGGTPLEGELQAEFFAGTRLYELNPALEEMGLALPTLPDVDHFALGGAIATGVHGTGATLRSLSDCVAGLTLVTPNGELIECSATRRPEVFNAARVSLGALGIVTRVRLQCREPYALTEVSKVEKTEDILADLDRRAAQHRHFEFMVLPNSELAASIATDYAKPGDADSGEDDPQAVTELRTIFGILSRVPGGLGLYDRTLKLLMADAAETVRTGPSWRILTHARVVRFREMEYMVPLDAGPACLREILRTIREKSLPVCFPLEYRIAAADDLWLSMFQGRASACIAVHQFADLDYEKYFAEIEPIFWKYQGRPHWGKLHTLDAKRLAALYPKHWRDYQEVRRSLDPQGRMLNPYLKQLLGA